MCYVFIHVFKTKMPISNSKAWNIILKFIKQWFHHVCSFIMYECCESGRKRREGVGWNTTLNQWGPCSFLYACHVGEPMMALTATWGITKSTTLCVLEISICSAWYNSIRQSNGITTTNKNKLWLTCNDKLFNKFVIFFLWRMTDAEVLKQTCVRLVRWRGFSCFFGNTHLTKLCPDSYHWMSKGCIFLVY